MKMPLLSGLLSLALLAGCATSGDLEELGASLKTEQEAYNKKLKQQQDEDRQQNQSDLVEIRSDTEKKLKQQQTELIELITSLESIQQQNFELLRREIQSGDQNVQTSIQDQLTSEIASLQIMLETNREKQENLQRALETLNLEVIALNESNQAELRKVNSELKAINEALNISRSIQNVQVAFGDIKNRLEDSRTRLSTQELLLRQLDSQIQKSERNNLLLDQDIQDLENRLKELLFVLEKHQQNKRDQAEGKMPENSKHEETTIKKEKLAEEDTNGNN